MSPRKVLSSKENITKPPPPLEAKQGDFVDIPPVIAAPDDAAAAPQPPKPCRTAFMCFSDAKREEIATDLGMDQRSAEVMIKDFSAAWKALSSEERAEWDEVARQDKVRYVKEKSEYKGPWELPKRRAKKHPMAPKRPMSAFLMFSKKRRQVVKQENPELSNTDVSRLLGEMWRHASEEEKRHFRERELVERADYKVAIAKFKAELARVDAVSRTSHESIRPQQQQHRPMNRRTLPLNRDHSIFKSDPPPPPPMHHEMTHHAGYYHIGSYGGHSSFSPSYSFNDESFDSNEPIPPAIFNQTEEQHVSSNHRQFVEDGGSHHSTSVRHEKSHSAPESYGYYGRYT